MRECYWHFLPGYAFMFVCVPYEHTWLRVWVCSYYVYQVYVYAHVYLSQVCRCQEIAVRCILRPQTLEAKWCAGCCVASYQVSQYQVCTKPRMFYCILLLL